MKLRRIKVINGSKDAFLLTLPAATDIKRGFVNKCKKTDQNYWLFLIKKCSACYVLHFEVNGTAGCKGEINKVEGIVKRD